MAYGIKVLLLGSTSTRTLTTHVPAEPDTWYGAIDEYDSIPLYDGTLAEQIEAYTLHEEHARQQSILSDIRRGLPPGSSYGRVPYRS